MPVWYVTKDDGSKPSRRTQSSHAFRRTVSAAVAARSGLLRPDRIGNNLFLSLSESPVIDRKYDDAGNPRRSIATSMCRYFIPARACASTLSGMIPLSTSNSASDQSGSIALSTSAAWVVGAESCVLMTSTFTRAKASMKAKISSRVCAAASNSLETPSLIFPPILNHPHIDKDATRGASNCRYLGVTSRHSPNSSSPISHLPIRHRTSRSVG